MEIRETFRSCRCGSGRKAKRCCARESIYGPLGSPMAAPARRPGESVFPKLARFARREEFAADMEEAIELFWGSSVEELSQSFGRPQLIELLVAPLVVTNFHNYFTLDYETKTGATLAELFLERKTHSLSAIERILMEDVRRSYVAPFAVAQPANGSELVLQSLWFARDDLSLAATDFVTVPDVDDILCLRVAELSSGDCVPVGDLYPFPPESRSRLLEALENFRDGLGPMGRSLPPRRLLRGATTLFHELSQRVNHGPTPGSVEQLLGISCAPYASGLSTS